MRRRQRLPWLDLVSCRLRTIDSAVEAVKRVPTTTHQAARLLVAGGGGGARRERARLLREQRLREKLRERNPFGTCGHAREHGGAAPPGGAGRPDRASVLTSADGTGRSCGGDDPSRLHPRPGPAGAPELRRAQRVAPGERALRPREGLLHRRRRPPRGRFEQANGGTIFLDEVARSRSPPQSSAALPQERTFDRVGGNETLKVDVPILAPPTRSSRSASPRASSARTSTTAQRGHPRIPPLRERAAHPRLASFFLARTPRRTASSSRASPRRAGALAPTLAGQRARVENAMERRGALLRPRIEARHLPSSISASRP